MAECEICGREGAGYLVFIEGARMQTCSECAKGGKILEAPRPAAPAQRQGMGGAVVRGRAELDIVADFGPKIKAARERMHIERNVLAEMINEKESTLERLEHEKMLPSESIALKLQKALGITLLEQDAGDIHSGAPRDKGKGLTLGDIVFVKKKKGEEE
ncbi:MAG: multiprotein bridging factor aMBF1 [Candidatus Burarchaeum sp.]|nr:multiprotein bridging factor aMBF1 [Candidatus Burarchaeum sp.]MDO8339402.1 multiprotein bridging factor aMBF1 [Candidatus Burarchaeum sp.]